MNLLANIDQMSPQEMDMVMQKITARKLSILQVEVEQLREQLALTAAKQAHESKELEVVKHRIDNIDCTNIEGSPRDRLNKMIRLYATKKGIYFNKAYRDFVQAYNTAYRTNLELRITNFCHSNGVKQLSTPDYLERVGQLEDAVRVADKMLNRQSA